MSSEKIDYRDPTHIDEPNDIDQTQVPPSIMRIAKWVRYKMYGGSVREAIARGIEHAGAWANEANKRSEDVEERFNDQIAGTTNSQEVIDARKPLESTAFKTLRERLNASDELANKLGDASTDLAQNMLRVNSDNNNLDKMSLAAKILRTDSTRVFQGAAFDSKGNLYLNEQSDEAGSQLINKYNIETGELITSRDLKLTEIVWLEGCSLVEDVKTGHALFVIPIDLNRNWVIYDFDSDTKSDPFKLEGEPKYCIDNTGSYLLTTQTQYNNLGDVNDLIVGFNLYDLQSVLALKPKIVKFIPVKDSLVRGGNKIQGVQLIDDYIYIGRGTPKQWLRTTVINTEGILVSDYNWDKQSLNQLFNINGTIYVESEGFAFIKLKGITMPVMSFLLTSSANGDLQYAFLAMGTDDGLEINYTAGASVASLTRPERVGSAQGLTFIAGGLSTDESLLVKFNRIKEPGTYNFTATEGNIGLSPNMKTISGIVVVREVADGLLSKATAFGVDYDNVFWSIYFDHNQWSKWSNVSGMPAHIIDNNFDPLTTNSGSYRTGSPVNSPAGNGAYIYDIKNSIGYKVIICYDVNRNEQYQRTFTPAGADSGWKKLSSVSVAKTAYELMTTNAALKNAQSQNAKMAYQIMTLGGKQ
ncbi:hypothetical protein QN289_03660 [Latilactobacillus curvatus]|uniref:hypothetical protein n=1 Tax=Latilactobacillus curvatus TaxID=28038 RepID=UPI0024E03B70|nr:hypothetical protein [Latilactobacillus curvatus]WIE01464.1 hypothetical protein QN289_03660 [Latilactobacillus curvatus]